MNLNIEQFLFSLPYMGLGMVGIFIVIGIIILSIVLLGMVTRNIEKKQK